MSVSKKVEKFVDEKFLHETLETVMGDRFGRYSKYIIQERAIPDVRDGLKPVQRRILYGMNKMGITYKSPFKKSARIVGEVMGKYHPHGDSSIYEAMVRMSQQWKMGVPLISMHGNNGSIDGDGPAAMRYTESRLSKNAEYLIGDIDKETVPFIPNFDEEEVEPTVLPAKFPNLLVNGAMGISSGYATYVPPHNFNEIINATIRLIEKPNLSIDELLEIVPGPDFPTGAIVQGLSGIREAFLTGSGSVVVQAKIETEKISTKQERIVVTEIPYDTNKQKTVEKIEQLRIDKKVDGILAVRDETDRTGLRIAIDLKEGTNSEAIIAYLLKTTDLRVNLKYNMVSIVNQVPKQLGVIPILKAYLEHEKEVVTNRTNFLLKKAKTRLHIVEGLIKMVDILDEVIKTIRASKNKADSKENLCSNFGFTELQAEAIVTMQLYRLSNTDIMALVDEKEKLSNNIVEYEKILSSDKELLKVIKQELKEINKEIVIPRKTQIEKKVAALKLDETDLIADETVYIQVTRDGYIKRASLKSVKAGTVNGLKDEDAIIYCNELSTMDTLLIFTDCGNYLYIPVYKIEESKFRDIGAFLSHYAQVSPEENVVKVFATRDFDTSTNVLLATSLGNIKQVSLADFNVTRYNKAIRAIKLSGNDKVVAIDFAKNPLEIVLVTKQATAIRYPASDVKIYGTNAGGLKAINMHVNDEVVSAFYSNVTCDILCLTIKGSIKRIKLADIKLSSRGRAGHKIIKLTKTNPHYIVHACQMTPNQYKENSQINIITENANVYLEAKDYKYKSAEAGQKVKELENTTPKYIILSEPCTADAPVDGSYLLDDSSNLSLFDLDMTLNQKPIKNKQKDVTDDLEAILAKEGLVEDDSKSKKNNKESKKFKTVNLFDEEV